MAEAGALDALVTLLVATVPDPADAKAAAPIPDLLRNLLRATLLLCDEYDARAALGAGETGGIETLLVVLDSEYSELQSLALSCLMAACRNNRNRMIVRVSGGLVKLLQFIGNAKFAASHSQALQVLAELLGDSSAMAAVSERGPVDKQNPTGTPAPVTALVSFVSAADNGTRVNALNCVCNAAKNAANRRILMDLKVEKAVAERLWSNDAKQPLNPKVAMSAINASISLAVGPSNAGELGAHGAVESMIKLLTWEEEACIVGAAKGLAALTEEAADNRILLVEAEGMAKVPALFDSDVPAKWGAAANIVHNIATSPAIRAREEFTAVKPLAGLVKCMGSSEIDVAVAGLRALALLASDAGFRREVAAEAAVPSCLLGLVVHANPDVKLAAWRAIRAVGREIDVATALCDLGCLDVLAPATNEFAIAAFNQLLNSQLSAKYAYTGRLDLSDVISGTFFDAGALRSGSQFKGLSTLREVPVTAHREVVLVSLPVPVPEGEPAEQEEGADSAAPAEPVDTDLEEFIASCKAAVPESAGYPEIAASIATAVSTRMGGAVSLNEAFKFAFDLPLAEAKLATRTNVIALGKITKGTYYHRALLFKVVADQVGLLSSLVRSEYGRAYNVIHTPEFSVVDVMHNPGAISKLEPHGDSPADLGDLQLPGNFFEYATKAA